MTRKLLRTGSILITLGLISVVAPVLAWQAEDGAAAPLETWSADNGNGTFTNPLFRDEFSDPDLIRVGDTFYLTGTTMHSMPGLPVLSSKDLVNWTFESYAFDRLDMGPEYRLENGEGAYGNGIWAPAIRYHDGTFYIFSNINGYGLQVYTSDSPKGPWERKPLPGRIHDTSILFDDDGRIYAVYDYNEVKLIEIKPDFSGFVEGSSKTIIPAGNGMGEGHHFYKIDGKYYIISANYSPVGRMQAARADHPYGPYETTVISSRETMGRGTPKGTRTETPGLPFHTKIAETGEKLIVTPSRGNAMAATPIHQGGIVDLPNGDWWGWSMTDMGAAGRMTAISPVTWKDGWPYFGVEGNLGRSPRTWVKPDVEVETAPSAPFVRDDDFASAELNPVWQWNHLPIEEKWSLSEEPGVLRLHTSPADNFFVARNTLTQRVVGPESSAHVTVDGSGLEVGDVAGLALIGYPYYWIGLARTEDGYAVQMYDRIKQEIAAVPVDQDTVMFKAHGIYEVDDVATLSYSADGGKTFTSLGDEVELTYQLKTFQGYRYGLFAYNTAGEDGGYADFDDFETDEPLSDRSANIPAGKTITITNFANDQVAYVHDLGVLHGTNPASPLATSDRAKFMVHDRGLGRVALEAADGSGFVTVTGLGLMGDVRLMQEETEDSLFQWQDMLRNQFMLISLKTNRFVAVVPDTGELYAAESPGPDPDRKDGSVLEWAEAE